ncbi:hypothetical protein U1Q18_044597 [Sarracenia purpurea var. burkii]
MTRSWKSTTRPVVGQINGSRSGGSDWSLQPGRRHSNLWDRQSRPRNQQQTAISPNDRWSLCGSKIDGSRCTLVQPSPLEYLRRDQGSPNGALSRNSAYLVPSIAHHPSW